MKESSRALTNEFVPPMYLLAAAPIPAIMVLTIRATAKLPLAG